MIQELVKSQNMLRMHNKVPGTWRDFKPLKPLMSNAKFTTSIENEFGGSETQLRNRIKLLRIML